MKISSKVVLVFFGTLLVIIIAYFVIPTPKSEEKQNTSDLNIDYDKLGDVIFTVKTKPVVKDDLVKTVTATGLLKAFSELDIVSNISGFINEINIYEGKYVRKGDLLLKYDDREQRIALSEAEVNLMNAKIEYGFFTKEIPENIQISAADSIKLEINRLESDFEDNKITEELYLVKKENLDLALLFTGAKRDEVMLNKSGMTNAINAINRARLNLSYTEIIAPFDGVIADFSLVSRARVTGGEKLFRLLDMSKLKVEVGILENEIRYIKPGSRCEIKLGALPGKIYKGKISYINPLVDHDTKTCRVTVEIPYSDKDLKPGMFASVNIETDILRDRVLIPKEALLVRDKRNLVFIMEEDLQKPDYSLAKWHYVQIGEQNENFIEILEGVSPGDNVIVEGHYNLAHDARIRPE